VERTRLFQLLVPLVGLAGRLLKRSRQSLPQRLKAASENDRYRSGELLRHPKTKSDSGTSLDASVESHPNVAKGATLGWGTHRLFYSAKAKSKPEVISQSV
jgi:hypothetical protein